MIKAISFDFYGVMYSNFDWGVINDRIYADKEKHAAFRELVDDANNGKIGNEEFRRGVIFLADDQNHRDEPAVHIEPIINKELMDYMQHLQHMNHLKLAILSNGSREHVCEVLEQQDVLDVFDLIATSAELPSYKPEKAAFDYVANKFGINNDELVHVDDSPRHIAGAKAAGVKTVLYTDLASLRSELNKLAAS